MTKSRIIKYRKKRTQRKSRRNMRTRKGGRPIPLPKVPPPINPVKNNIKGRSLKGGFRADIVDNIEDRDDDWIITKQ